jgi:hypothetical protein
MEIGGYFYATISVHDGGSDSRIHYKQDALGTQKGSKCFEEEEVSSFTGNQSGILACPALA